MYNNNNKKTLRIVMRNLIKKHTRICRIFVTKFMNVNVVTLNKYKVETFFNEFNKRSNLVCKVCCFSSAFSYVYIVKRLKSLIHLSFWYIFEFRSRFNNIIWFHFHISCCVYLSLVLSNMQDWIWPTLILHIIFRILYEHSKGKYVLLVDSAIIFYSVKIGKSGFWWIQKYWRWLLEMFILLLALLILLAVFKSLL